MKSRTRRSIPMVNPELIIDCLAPALSGAIRASRVQPVPSRPGRGAGRL